MVKKVEHCEKSGCPLACSLDIIGDHWSLLIVRELMIMGHHEYKEFMDMPEGISSNILSDRLKKLENNNLVASANHPNSKRRKLYYLTKSGKDLVYPMFEIAKWANRNIAGKLDIPDNRRPLLKMTPEEFAETVLKPLETWEKENIL
jgi:DNA-binding HxlR family transcriptional regulator